MLTLLEKQKIDKNVDKCPFCTDIVIFEEKLKHCVLFHNKIMITLFEKLHRRKIKLLEWLQDKPYIVYD